MPDDVDEIKIHPAGEYVGIIVDIGDVRASITQQNMLILPITIKTEFGNVFTFLSGYFSTIRFLLMFRETYLQERIKIRVAHRVSGNGTEYASVAILERIQ